MSKAVCMYAWSWFWNGDSVAGYWLGSAIQICQNGRRWKWNWAKGRAYVWISPKKGFGITGSCGAGTALRVVLDWGRSLDLYTLVTVHCWMRVASGRYDPGQDSFVSFFFFSVETIAKRGLATEGCLSETEEPILYSHRGVWVIHQHYCMHENLTCDNLILIISSF